MGDGALGFWEARDEIFPTTRHQRCWVHKIVNILDKVPMGQNQLPMLIKGVRFVDGVAVGTTTT